MKNEWLFTTATQTVLLGLMDAGYQAYAVGGCVRNTLMGLPASDIDIATSGTPNAVGAFFEKKGLKVIPTGIDHGTVTVICEGVPYEITTFRKDVQTDGRYAKVLFSDDIKDDASRRDFTMNALYMAADGQVIDPLSGLNDLNARLVRFIEDPAARVQEDYLRILRFFRFYAWYGDPSQGIDPLGLAACAAEVEGLVRIAPERIGHEMIKLMSAPNPAPAIAAMRAAGVLGAVVEGMDDTALAPFIHLSQDFPIDPMARLAAIGGSDVSRRLRLSNAQRDQLDLYRAEISSSTHAGALGYLHGYEAAANILALRSALFETPLIGLTNAKTGSECVFPIRAKDLMPVFEGVALGAKLKALKSEWMKSDFQLSREELLERAGL